MRCSAYEGCQAGRGISAWCFSLNLGRARRSGREAESRAAAPRPRNRSDSERPSRLLVCVCFFYKRFSFPLARGEVFIAGTIN